MAETWLDNGFEKLNGPGPDLKILPGLEADASSGSLAGDALSATDAKPKLLTDHEIIGNLILEAVGDIYWSRPENDEPIYIRTKSFIDRGGWDEDPRQQLRAVWNATARISPYAILNPTGATAPEALKRTRLYLNKSAKLGGLDIPRQEILPPQPVLTHLEVILRAQDDPVIRVLDKIADDFVGEEFTTASYRYLKGDALMATKGPLIREVYEAYINQVRRWGRAISKTRR